MNILVTGASGFIGPAIVRELLARGHRLRLALRRADPVSLFGDRVSKAAIADLAEPIDWSPLLDGVEGLVHAAGVAHAGTRNVSSYLFAVNAEATDRLMRAAMRAGVSRVVYISSVRAIAGTRYDGLIQEDHSPQPTNDYGRSKLEGERAVAASGLRGAILRPPLVHGAHVKGNLSLLARAAASPFPLPLGGLQGRRSIVSDRNLASAAAFLIQHPPDDLITALVADPEPLTVSEIITKLRACDGRNSNLVAVPGPMSLLFATFRQRSLWDALSGRLELAPRRLAANGWRADETSDAGLARTMAALRVSRTNLPDRH